ncbi:MAG: diaminopimelate decarboxylase [Candidatus Eisenbacteria bacterium]|nr:diaminopimelate decarboxylase [Candidatus Eisenbacteria bacterium]
MHLFSYREGSLFCEGVSLTEIASQAGTPSYVYSLNTILNHFRRYVHAWAPLEPLVAYSVKACSNLAILRAIAKRGAGADIVSGGELHRALKAGFPPGRIIFGGVGKTDDEIDFALDSGILFFNVDSLEELAVLNELAKRKHKRAKVALRINPHVESITHPYVRTGGATNKFGIDIGRALESCQKAAALPGIELVGIHEHIGSQIVDVGPFKESLLRLLSLLDELKTAGIDLKFLDLGGGLGITYKDEKPPELEKFAREITSLINERKLNLVLEPGRVIAGNAGILLTRVIQIKRTQAKKFIIVDAAMNDLMRPALYDAYHEILPVRETKERETADVVGAICETGDFFAKDRRIANVEREELLAVMSAGAYGFSMSSNYNSRPRCAEVLVKGDRFAVIRERETYEDLERGESIPSFVEEDL